VVSEGPPARSVTEILADPPKLQLTSTSAVEAAWSDLLGYWVRNRGFPEDEARMRQAFLDAVQRRGLEEVVATTRHYATRVASGRVGMPYHLSKFLGDDTVYDRWRAAAAVAVTPEDEAAFKLAFDRYPNFPKKAEALEESRSYYFQFVAPADAADFLLAVVGYGDERFEADDSPAIGLDLDEDDEYVADDDAAKFTQTFVKFVGRWRSQERGDATASCCHGALSKAVKQLGIEPPVEWSWTQGECDCLFSMCRYWAVTSPPDQRRVADVLAKFLASEGSCLKLTAERRAELHAAAMALAYAEAVRVAKNLVYEEAV